MKEMTIGTETSKTPKLDTREAKATKLDLSQRKATKLDTKKMKRTKRMTFDARKVESDSRKTNPGPGTLTREGLDIEEAKRTSSELNE